MSVISSGSRRHLETRSARENATQQMLALVRYYKLLVQQLIIHYLDGEPLLNRRSKFHLDY